MNCEKYYLIGLSKGKEAFAHLFYNIVDDSWSTKIVTNCKINDVSDAEKIRNMLVIKNADNDEFMGALKIYVAQETGYTIALTEYNDDTEINFEPLLELIDINQTMIKSCSHTKDSEKPVVVTQVNDTEKSEGGDICTDNGDMNTKIYYVIGLNSVLTGNERSYYDGVFDMWSTSIRVGAKYDDIIIAKNVRRELLTEHGTKYIDKLLKIYMVKESGNSITMDEYFDVKQPVEPLIEDLKGVVEELRSYADYAEKYDMPIITAQQSQKSNDDEEFDINKYITSESGGLESVEVVTMRSGTMMVSQGELETIIEETLFELGLHELRVGPSVEIYPNLSSEQLYCILYLTADIEFVGKDFDNIIKKVDSIVPNSIVQPINKFGLDEGFVSLKLNGHRVLESLGIVLESIYLGKHVSYGVRFDAKCNTIPYINDKYICRTKSPSTNKFSIRTIKSRSNNRVEDLLKKDKLTEEEFLKIVNAGLQDKLNLRTEVTLPNSKGTTDVWVVADVNHDSTSGTVDLISKNLICDNTGITYGENFGSSQIYRRSLLRLWLTGAYFNGFSTAIQNALKTMDVVTDENGEIVTTHDKIKLLSMNEVGLTNSDWAVIPTTVEGSMYPIFENGDGDSANAKRKKYKADGTTNWYWTRTRYTGSSNYVCFVGSYGSYNGIGYAYAFGGVVPAIRF